MLDDVAEGFFRTLGELLAHAVFGAIYYTGWLVLRIITLGHYPPRYDPMLFEQREHSRAGVAFVGVLVWGAIGTLIYRVFF